MGLLTLILAGTLSVAHAASIPEALDLLMKSPAGAQLLDQARTRGSLQHLRSGEVSRTDAVLTRQFDPQSGQEVRSREVEITIRTDQAVEDVALDIAHELTHALAPAQWDPYDPSLTMGKYLWVSLEGPGGEIDAVEMECRVGEQVAAIQHKTMPRCERYLGKHGVSRAKIQADFYRVGSLYTKTREALGAEAVRFPLLSTEAAQLFSATGGKPYPAALIEEYRAMNRTACDNARRRAPAGESPLLGSRCESARALSSRQN